MNVLSLTSRFIGVHVIFILLAQPALSIRRSRHYPAIKSASISIETNLLKPKNSDTLVIRDINDKPAYELSIYAVSRNERNTEQIVLELSTTGKYLPDPEEKYEPNLLNPDFYGHGAGQVFDPEELCPTNANNPIRGARREFYFRRMHIVAQVSDIELSDDCCSLGRNAEQIGGLNRMRITISIFPSRSRRSRPRDIPYPDLKPCK